MTLDELKLYLRIDGSDEDALIQGLQAAAEQFLKNGGASSTNNVDLYNLCAKLLIAHWYENREVVGKSEELPFGLRSMITQLKYCTGDVV